MEKFDKDISTEIGARELISALEKNGIHSELRKKLQEKISNIPSNPVYKNPLVTESMHINDAVHRPGGKPVEAHYDYRHNSKHITYDLYHINAENEAMKQQYNEAASKVVGDMQDNLKTAKNIYNKIAKKTEGRNLNFINFEGAFKQSSQDQNKIAAMHSKIGSAYSPIESNHSRFSGKKFKYDDITDPIDLQLRHALNKKMRNK